MPTGLRRIRALRRVCGTNNDPASVDARSGLVQESLRLINREWFVGAHEREGKTLTLRSTGTDRHGHAILGGGGRCVSRAPGLGKIFRCLLVLGLLEICGARVVLGHLDQLGDLVISEGAFKPTDGDLRHGRDAPHAAMHLHGLLATRNVIKMNRLGRAHFPATDSLDVVRGQQ